MADLKQGTTVGGNEVLHTGNFKVSNYPGFKGDTGAQGPTGPQGAQGPTGAQGPQGAQGTKGHTGAQGAKGNTGATGPVGPVGPQGGGGAQGTKGQKGEIGPKGNTGNTGPTGPTEYESMHANFALSGGGDVSWNGSSVTWTERLIAIPTDRSLAASGYLDIGPATFTIPAWSGIWYRSTRGQSNSYDAAKIIVAA